MVTVSGQDSGLGRSVYRVLLISYFFPPNAVIGSVRAEGLAKYLPHHGWEVVVLTADHPGGPDPRYRVYEAPHRHWLRVFESFGELAQISKGSATRSRPRKAARWARSLARNLLCYPDAQRGWYKSAVEHALGILDQYDFDAIVSTSKPETCHLVASRVARLSGLPWVADFRDLWTLNHYAGGPLWKARRLVEQRLEKRTLREADAIVCVSQPLADAMKGMFADKLVTSIPNGYDPDTIAPRGQQLTEAFTITYTGTLYGGKRDPSQLFRVIRRLADETAVDPQSLRVRFYGSERDVVETRADQYGVGSFVEVHGRISRAEALQRQRESHALLSLHWDTSRDVGVYTGKLFEYLAARRPVLAVGGPGGVVKELLHATRAGVHVQTDDELKRVLVDWYSQYRQQGCVSYEADERLLEEYSHIGMARKFSDVLQQVTKQRKRANPHGQMRAENEIAGSSS